MPTGKRFKPLKKYYLPDKKRRKRALILGGFGLVLAAAGIPIGFFFNVTAGAVCALFGVFLLARALIAFVQARGMLAVYAEGLYWREIDRRESVFLKWEEIGTIREGEHKGFPILTVHCAYGDYHFPKIGDAWEYLSEQHGEKCDA